MGALASGLPTLYDLTKRMDPNGTIADVGEVLTKFNDILDDIGWKEGNLPTGEQITIRTNKPTPTFRLLNGGIVPHKSATGQLVETCAIMEDRSHVDVDVANLNGDAAAFRLSEDVAFIQGFSDTLATTLIYGDTSVDPEQFNGLASRYFSLNATHVTSSQIIDAGGTGADNTSIWLCCWSPQTMYGIYPKGSRAGLFQEDRGIQDLLVNPTTGAYMRAYVTFFQWKCGFAIKDYRAVVRIANIDVSNLLTSGDASDTSCDLIKLMIRAIGKLPPNMAGRRVFYMNETVRTMLNVKFMNKSNGLIRIEDMQRQSLGTPQTVTTFQGIVCRRIDAILNTETQIT